MRHKVESLVEASNDTQFNSFQSALQSQSLPLTSNRSIESSTRPVGINRRDISLPTGNILDLIDENKKNNCLLYTLDNETKTYLSSCSCENHLAKSYADRLFTFNVDKLFQYLFGDNSFTSDFHNSQKLTGKY